MGAPSVKDYGVPEAHRGSDQSGGGYPGTRDGRPPADIQGLAKEGRPPVDVQGVARDGAEQARINSELLRQAERLARSRELAKPHTARDLFKKAPASNPLDKKPQERSAAKPLQEKRADKRPHCMPQPKRGKTRGGGGKSKGFVPFCERK